MGARTYAMSHTPEALRPRLDELFDQADYGYLTTAQFIDQAAELLGITSDEFRSRLDRQYARDERMVQLIRQLRATHKVGLLSNANDSIIRRLFTSEELEELFDEVTISSEVGMIKPQPQLFELVATRLGCLPEECVMVDDIARNIEGAQEAGMRGIVFTSKEQCVRELEVFGIYA